MGETPEIITKLRHPTKEHGEFFEEEARSAIKRNKEKANELYKDFSESQEKINLNEVEKPPESSEFHKTYEKYATQIDNLRNLFGEASDAGPALVKEIKKLHEFFRPREMRPVEYNEYQGGTQLRPIGAGTDVSASRVRPEKITPKQINDHVRTLQNEAARLTSEGKNIEAKPLWELAEGLKHDLHAILKSNGYEKEATSLKSGNEFFMKNIVPWSTHPETRRVIRSKNYKPDKAAFSKAIHNPNLKAVFDALPKQVRNAAAYEMLVKNAQKAGLAGHYLTPKEVMTRYMKGLSPEAKNALAKNSPEVHKHLEALPRISDAITEHEIAIKDLDAEKNSIESIIQQKLAHGESLGFKANKALNAIKNKKKSADEVLERHIKEAYHGKAHVSTKITGPNDLKSLGYGAAAAGGFGAIGHLLAGHAIPSALAYAALAKGAKSFNEIMTDPAMVKHFLEGTKFKKEAYSPKDQSYSKKLTKALTLLGTKQQPMEIDMTGGHRE